jgi:hypothetical protein
LVPDLVPKYLVTVGTRWYLLGLAVAPLYQRVPTSPNSHKHFQDSNSLGGTIRPQVRGLSSPISSVKSGYKCLWAEGGCEVKAQLRGGVDASLQPNSSPLCPESASTELLPGLLPDCTGCPVALNFLLAVGRRAPRWPHASEVGNLIKARRGSRSSATSRASTARIGDSRRSDTFSCRVRVSRYQRKRGGSRDIQHA